MDELEKTDSQPDARPTSKAVGTMVCLAADGPAKNSESVVPSLGLVLISIVMIISMTLINCYFSSRLDVNIGYFASSTPESLCRALRELDFLASILPIFFLTLGLAAALQVVLFGTFHLSIFLAAGHVVHFLLLTLLFIFGNGYCHGIGLFLSTSLLWETVLFAVLLTALPIPLVIFQLSAMRHEPRSTPKCPNGWGSI